MARIKKFNALLGLVSIAAMLVHIAYTAFAYLTFYYNPVLKYLTAIPVMVLVCLHAICGMSLVFLQSDGTALNLYPGYNRGTILQRVSAALIFPLLILHINTFTLLSGSAAKGQWVFFGLLMASQPLFYAVLLTHVCISLSRALITLGLISSREAQRKIDRAAYILGALIFAAVVFIVLRTELAMFLPAGGTQ